MIQKNVNFNELWGKLIIEELIRNNVDYFCISPGSRSAPLVCAAARNKKAQKIICLDERGSAFHALGYAQATNKPAAVIVTSGTAVANLFPAIVEAHQNSVPMVVLTADRPPELLDTGANQTINQAEIFGRYVKWFFGFPCPDKTIHPKMILTAIDYAVYLSTNSPEGPVHINCMFREPLEPDEYIDENQYKTEDLFNLSKWSRSKNPYTFYVNSKITCGDPEIIKQISEIIQKEKKGLISIGPLKTSEEKKEVLELVKKINWPVYADITSCLRLNDEINTNIIKHFDQDILSLEFNKKASPDTVIHFGGKITSKRFHQFLNQNHPENYIIIKDNPIRYDPVHLITMHVESDIVCFCRDISRMIKTKKQTDFKHFYDIRAKKAQEIIEKYINDQADVDEVFVSRCISEEIPDKSCLFLSNSMPIRDLELYGQSSSREIIIGSNRGASGIDGIISSAIGFTNGFVKICTLLIGDIAFMHDLNSLATISSLKKPLIIVVINNNGGGIFHFLPIVKIKDIFEEYFATPHNLNFEGAAKSFKINYFSVSTNKEFRKIYKDALKLAGEKETSSIIEVFTDRESNLKLRKEIKDKIIKVFEQ
ncbi:MAG: 2-succinyl-5-enolpyruvyl-6-hydroxy-3-cyclohexene-1-carboxylic-acid synthase [Candidatus Humimicrobiaceae bacterium]